MSNDKQFKILMEGSKIWNDWRKLYPDETIDLSKADLRMETVEGANLSGVNLAGADFRKASGVEADFSKANLSGANLQRVNTSKADFSGANLKGADLRDAKLAGADFSGANLTGVIATESDFLGASFRGANLAGADLKNSQLKESTGLTQEQLDQAVGNASTGLPEGLRPPKAWAEQPDR